MCSQYVGSECEWRRTNLQGNEEAVEVNADQLERGRRETQQAELLSNFSNCEQGPVAAPWPTAAFDDSAVFLMFPSWRGIAVGNINSGKVCNSRRLPPLAIISCALSTSIDPRPNCCWFPVSSTTQQSRCL